SGEYHDKESGFIYLRARYYDPETGRFISEDPAMDGTNWYVYCSNNPVMFVDPCGLSSYIFYADGMGDQAKVRADIYTEQYGTNSYTIHVGSANEFVDSWNDNVIFPTEPIDAIEIISHGSITGDTGMNKYGSANSTGYLYFGKDKKDRLFARDVQNMKSGDYSVYKLLFAEAKELHINACNSANPDTYNVVYGFMQRTDILYETRGFDGGAMWSEKDKDHVMGGGEVLTGFKALTLGTYYYVKKYQATWWKYVDKDDGEPIRSREGERCFYSY
ncbi:MAG: RHS repeat-associated core domain-containing protein, partial [Clostridia bacterium]|nr:RHS repeat-associated core domain-containing protein [Clostridia bacterium]